MPQAPFRDNIPVDGMGDGVYAIGKFDNNRANAQVMVAAKATEYKSGTVLGKVTATGIYAPLDPNANDGTQTFAGIMWARRPANAAAAQRAAVTVRELTINNNLLIYENAVTNNQKAAIEAAMAAVGIISGY
jgi:Bacteriophage lambda head decoration protein D